MERCGERGGTWVTRLHEVRCHAHSPPVPRTGDSRSATRCGTWWYTWVNFRKFYAKRKSTTPPWRAKSGFEFLRARGAEIILAIRVPNAFSNALWYALWYEQWNKYLLTNRWLCGIARADKCDYFTKSSLVKKKSFRQIKFFA